MSEKFIIISLLGSAVIFGIISFLVLIRITKRFNKIEEKDERKKQDLDKHDD
ncbi:MAG: hypothetical protein H7Y41_07775 [Hyphomonadaceae bacterium]|nr:hypothetical protein [Clostridia bacterium]